MFATAHLRRCYVKQLSFISNKLSSLHLSNVPIISTGISKNSYSTNIIAGHSADYLDELYDSWSKNPHSVSDEWRKFFETQISTPVATIHHTEDSSIPITSTSFDINQIVQDAMKVQQLVRAYQVRGHHRAYIDPLNIVQPIAAPELDPEYYGLTETHYDKEFILGDGVLPHFRSSECKTMTFKDILSTLKSTYCGTIGIEYTHIPDRAQCDWIRSKFEVPVKYSYTIQEKHAILDRLIWADSFERFLHTKFPGEKRFGLEGCETLIPGMKAMIDRSVDHNVNNIVLGMPHRGRLNVLSNVVRKPAESIFGEFFGELDPNAMGSGDVKYHLGLNCERSTPSGKRVHLSLVANPSHLEAVDPVVLGKTKALQFHSSKGTESAMAILLHGDAAFAAQGVVYESLGFSDLPNYTTGGTIHIIVNNQIGFTTDPRFARSTPYCTELAKSINAPILHVNADDPEAIVFACQFAADWRHQYSKDIVIDIVGYRRHGHNEFDEPMFTQPRMYKEIGKKTRVVDVYIEQLLKEGAITSEQITENKTRVWNLLEEGFSKSKTYKPSTKEWLTSAWDGFKSLKDLATQVFPGYDTGVGEDTLKHVGQTISTIPHDFDIHKGLGKILETRKKTIDNGEGIDWSTAESLAFGTLLLEGNHVRLSGQDVERGTFSQRHAVLHDQTNESRYTPLSNLDPSQAKFAVCNSSLSEFGVLGFELGYSLVNPRDLVLWEAQFGDFDNEAQCIIDLFIVSGERKWSQRSGLVMMLPHGFDGNGPEHSSGRIERFLELCDDDPNIFPDFSPEKCRQIQDCNIQIISPSTPANVFHALRRQIRRDFRKPLIMFNSKALLRHPMAKSNLSEMIGQTRFVRVYPESNPSYLVGANQVKTVVFCSSQLYYTLYRAREANNIKNLALIRIEQISPFPFDLVAKEMDNYPNAKIIWAQEEPLNMGAWSYVYPRFKTAMIKTKHHNPIGKKLESINLVEVVARPPSAAVATGLKKIHHTEENNIISQVLFGKIMPAKKEVGGVPIW